MGGPARVADAEQAVDGAELDGLLEIAQLSFGATNVELIVSAIHGEAGRVVPAILQPLQTLQNDRDRFLRSNVSYDSAHRDIIGLRRRAASVRGTGEYRLVEELDAEVLYYRIGEDVARDRFDVLLRLLPSDPVGERDIEELALPHGCDCRVAETVERRADGLALRVQHSGLQRNEDASFHVNL